MGVAEGLLIAAGTPEAHACIQADHLLEAELRGHPSHGLQRLPRLLDRIAKGLADPRTRGAASWNRSGELHVDGRQGLGPVVAHAAIDALVERVGASGIAFAAIRNANHLGMLAGYVDRIARTGQIGMALSTSEALVHPHGGTRAMLGTNPIAIGIPTGAEPFVLDLATSRVSMGKIHDHAMRGAPLPDGWALDAEGKPTTDADLAKLGSIAPFGGAKGYGLGLAFELLVASLAGSAFAPQVHGTLDATHPVNKGDLFIVIDPAQSPFGASGIGAYLDLLRSSPPADAASPVSVPGDRARARRQNALEAGFDINDRLWSDLTDRLASSSSTPLAIRELQT
nr:Ldh family oxidoreductase [Devosia lucknowensis]